MSDYKFVETDSEKVVKMLVESYETLTGRTLLPADPDKIFISWVAQLIVQERALINFAAGQNIPSRAIGENLDALGEFIYNVQRPQAQPAEVEICFEISAPQSSAVAIPKGTKLTDISKTLVWETTEDTAVPIGAIYAMTRAVCQTAGEIGNGFAEGQINTLIDVDNVPFYKAVSNTTTSSGGSETANDNTYRELMRKSLEAYSTAGPKGAYEYHAKAVSTAIADVCAINPIDKPGHVEIYAIMDDGTIADSGTKQDILKACNDDRVRPLTDIVEVCDPEEVEFDVKLTYYVDQSTQKSLMDIETAVNAAVAEFVAWQTAKIGRDINPTQLVWLLSNSGIKRAEITSPEFTSLRDGTARLTPQVAKIGTVTVSFGGYEDE
ncbi:MAG: baseplate J/gp47 family protein [Oscillospiraceae bacterium]|nr:baseplate J/gp47 family protein [Oscillospiraceae bacterium]